MSLLYLLAELALAQDAASQAFLETDLYRPPIETDGHLWTEDAGIGPDGITHLTVQSNYIFDPRTETAPDNDYESERQALRTDIIGTGALGGVQVGIDVPVYVVDTSDLFSGEGGIGDVALDLKAGLPEIIEDNPVNLAAGINLLVPTTADNVAATGVDSVAWEARIVGDATLEDRVNLAANIGTRGFPDEVVDTDGFTNQFIFRGGAGVDIVEDAGLSVDVVGAVDYDTPIDDQEMPVQGYVGGYGTIADQFQVVAGIGSGLIPGTEGPGPRAMLALSWMPSAGAEKRIETVGVGPRSTREVDEDGETRPMAEPVDRFERDGAEPDAARAMPEEDGAQAQPRPVGREREVGRDRRAAAEPIDQCPGQAEDLDGFEDEDGCPDVDNDRDNVADLADRCPDAPEDFDGLHDDDGCADEENPVSVRIRDENGEMLGATRVSIEKDGRVVESGVGSLDAELEPGVYTLKASGDGFEPVETEFRVYPDDKVQISATMSRSEEMRQDERKPEDEDLPRRSEPRERSPIEDEY